PATPATPPSSNREGEEPPRRRGEERGAVERGTAALTRRDGLREMTQDVREVESEQVPPPVRRRSMAGYLFMPAVLAVAGLALYLYVSVRDLDTIEARSLNASRLFTATWQHVQLTAVSTIVTLVIAIPLGIVLTRAFAARIRP